MCAEMCSGRPVTHTRKHTHGWSAKGLQHFLGATKCAFSLLYIVKLGLSPEIPNRIDIKLKIQKTPILYIEVACRNVQRFEDICSGRLVTHTRKHTIIGAHICTHEQIITLEVAKKQTITTHAHFLRHTTMIACVA